MFATQDSSWGSVSYSCAKKDNRGEEVTFLLVKMEANCSSPEIEKGGHTRFW
jgi:hypothetical protein